MRKSPLRALSALFISLSLVTLSSGCGTAGYQESASQEPSSQELNSSEPAKMEAAPPMLTGSWELSRIKTDKIISVPKQKGFAFTLTLSKPGKANGKVACNQWQAGYSLKDNKLQLSKAGTTRKLCNSQQAFLKELERRFLLEL
ncbi:MAG: META domain-containing protein, partial [Pseudomonadales bacterium]|nr:META domain-containing protein [Pseudomonadales bacterium]